MKREYLGYKDHIFWLRFVEANRVVTWLEVSENLGLGEGLVICNSEKRLKEWFWMLKTDYEKAGLVLPKIVMMHGAYDEMNCSEVLLGEEPLN